MTLFTSTLISGIIQVLIFSLIPFITWFIIYKNKIGYLQWIGLKKVSKKKLNDIHLYSAVTLSIFTVLSYYLLKLLKDLDLANSRFVGLGVNGIPSVLVYAFVVTALSEEIIFRGFILKRLSDRLGFKIGNIIQCILFGALHGAMFFPITSAITSVLIIIVTSGIGYLMGYVNEEKADGSIIPSWILHGLANFISSFLLLFNLL